MSDDQTNVLQVTGLHTRFHTQKGTVRAVDGISFEVGKGKVVGWWVNPGAVKA